MMTVSGRAQSCTNQWAERRFKDFLSAHYNVFVLGNIGCGVVKYALEKSEKQEDSIHAVK